MDTKAILERIQKQKQKKTLLKQFKKSKKYVLNIYPNSVLKITINQKYYLEDENGFRILREEYCIPDCNTPFDAWNKTHRVLWSKHIVDRNNKKFSDERIIRESSKKDKTNKE